jgi:hypothetical protein
MYALRMPTGAPPRLAAKRDGDQRTPFQYLGKDGTKSVDRISAEYPISVLCDGDQLDMKLRNTVLNVSNVANSIDQAHDTFRKMARKTFKFRLYPNRQQREKLTATLDVCRELYNAGLQERIEAWKCRSLVRVFDQINQLPDIKEILPDVAGVFS